MAMNQNPKVPWWTLWFSPAPSCYMNFFWTEKNIHGRSHFSVQTGFSGRPQMKVIQNQLCTELLPHFSATSRLTRSPIPAAQNSV
jgi:hypothetical protein